MMENVLIHAGKKRFRAIISRKRKVIKIQIKNNYFFKNRKTKKFCDYDFENLFVEERKLYSLYRREVVPSR